MELEEVINLHCLVGVYLRKEVNRLVCTILMFRLPLRFALTWVSSRRSKIGATNYPAGGTTRDFFNFCRSAQCTGAIVLVTAFLTANFNPPTDPGRA